MTGIEKNNIKLLFHEKVLIENNIRKNINFIQGRDEISPYPMLQIVSGKSGSGKTHLVLKELLTPGFLGYKEIYVLSPNINTKEYQFLKHGFEHNINKEILLKFFPNLNKFRLSQIPEM